ncbi:MAG: translation initiation factor IF-1 [Akkermansiaceae bacterium]
MQGQIFISRYVDKSFSAERGSRYFFDEISFFSVAITFFKEHDLSSDSVSHPLIYPHLVIARPRNFRRGGGGGRRRGRRRIDKSGNTTEGDEQKSVEIEGIISAVLAGTMFKVALPSGHEVLAHISGKMRKRFIRLVIGDKVKMEMSPYDTTKARIVFRLG